MAIAVNRVAINANYCYNTAYFTRVARVCPASSTALVDGSFLICKAGGVAWFVAPASTEISRTWGGTTDVSGWSPLSACLSAAGYTPTEWFVPTQGQLQNPGFVCRANWSYTITNYWSSTDGSGAFARYVNFVNNCSNCTAKGNSLPVRAFRCVTY